MRILITGSRDWPDDFSVDTAIGDAIQEYWKSDPPPEGTRYAEPIVVVHGDCPTGADRIARDYTRALSLVAPSVSEEAHPADWNTYGKRAGFLRNKEMVDLGADICLAFIKDNSRGASMTARLAKEAGIIVKEFRK